MTPDCCDRAWAKATGKVARYDTVQRMWVQGNTRWMVPKPTSAEWLAEIVEAAEYLNLQLTPEGDYSAIWAQLQPTPGDYHISQRTAPDRRRALCAALNGKPCEREAA